MALNRANCGTNQEITVNETRIKGGRKRWGRGYERWKEGKIG
jgi:hypothetical protein